MDEKLNIFWNLDVLVKMCRTKSDGPSLRVEETEILEKINTYEAEIEEIKAMLEEDTYDTSAEMADRNIEIITKKQLQSLKASLKEKNKLLNKLKDDEKTLYNQTSLLRENKSSNEKYIASMQERLSESTNKDVLDRYNSLITETLTKINEIAEELKIENSSYEEVQTAILQASADIEDLEARIDKKKKLLAETQTNLENKDNYIDKTKREKNNKKINDITSKIETLQQRLDDIRKDPKYIETKIKDIINSKEDKQNAREYLSELVKLVINQPYINVPTGNALEEELLRATQARDSFANEIDQKSYNILEAKTPEKVRTDFLSKRIENWKNELVKLRAEIERVDKDSEYKYEEIDAEVEQMIKSLKNDLKEFEKAYNETSDSNISAKASLEVALEEKKEDVQEAEKIANLFKVNEAEDISNATRILKYQCEQLNDNIASAEEEIKKIRNRLMSRKSGLIDIVSRNKDKEVLRDLAQTVIDIKHRRQFPERPLDIIRRLEEELDVKVLGAEELEKIEQTSKIESKNYDEFISEKYVPKMEEKEELALENYLDEEEKELEDINVIKPDEILIEKDDDEDFQKLADQAMGNVKAENIDEDVEGADSTSSGEGSAPTELTTPAVEEQPVGESIVEKAAAAAQAANNSNDEEIVEKTTEPMVEEVSNEETTAVTEKEVIEEPVETITEEKPVIEENEVEQTDTEEPVEGQEEAVNKPTPEESTAEATSPVIEEQPVIAPESAEPVKENVTEATIPEIIPAVEEQPLEKNQENKQTVDSTTEEAAEPVITEEEVSEEPIIEEAPIVETTITEAPIINESENTEKTSVEEVQDNPFGDAINPLERNDSTPTTEPIVELTSNNQKNDLSADAMFSNSVEINKPNNNEKVRNNLSGELDNSLNENKE